MKVGGFFVLLARDRSPEYRMSNQKALTNFAQSSVAFHALETRAMARRLPSFRRLTVHGACDGQVSASSSLSGDRYTIQLPGAVDERSCTTALAQQKLERTGNDGYYRMPRRRLTRSTTRLERAAIKLHRFLHANLGGHGRLADQIHGHRGAHAGALPVAQRTAGRNGAGGSPAGTLQIHRRLQKAATNKS